MPKVLYPFSSDHEHAGKYYKGWMPAGAVGEMLKQSGAILAERCPQEPDLPVPQVPSEDIISSKQLLLEELKEAEAQWKDVKADLEANRKKSLATRTNRRVKSLVAGIKEAAKNCPDEEVEPLRKDLETLERAVTDAEIALGYTIPQATAAVPRTAGPVAAAARE